MLCDSTFVHKVQHVRSATNHLWIWLTPKVREKWVNCLPALSKAPNAKLSFVHTLTQLTTTLRDSHHYPHFTAGETEAQGSDMTCCRLWTCHHPTEAPRDIVIYNTNTYLVSVPGSWHIAPKILVISYIRAIGASLL